MKEIAENIYIEEGYPGVTLGAIKMIGGSVLIDSPPRPEDSLSWHSSLQSQGIASSRLLVNLDSHPDRTIGARAMNTTVIAHQVTSDEFSNRTAMFKAQNANSGAEWEECSGLSGIRWQPPNLTFSDQITIKWGKVDVVLKHQPGHVTDAAWVIIPDKKVVFVGDAVTVRQPPFLENADISLWVNSLDLLLSNVFTDYIVISGRGGLASGLVIRDMRNFLIDVQKRLDRIAARDNDPHATEKLVPKLIDKYKFPSKHREMYTNRLRHGLYQYYAEQLQPAPASNLK